MRVQFKATLILLNGRIAHGLQLTSGDRRSEPTTYFGPQSGVGLAIRRHPRRLAGSPMRVGVIGLGVGYGRLSRSADFTAHSETAVELYYMAQLFGWLQVSPDIQLIRNPGGNHGPKNAVVGGIRAQAELDA